ncbi:hypothetical protein [Nevskia soli]|nr:hypothetical protein [Nevskia soli]
MRKIRVIKQVRIPDLSGMLRWRAPHEARAMQKTVSTAGDQADNLRP